MYSLRFLTSAVLAICLLAAIGYFVSPYDPYETQASAILLGPSASHWMGTDMHGRDILSRVLAGASTSLFTSLLIVLVSLLLGTLVGLVAGYRQGLVDSLFMRLVDIFLAFPDFLLALTVAGLLGGGIESAMLAIILTSWTQYARLARNLVGRELAQNYVKAARMSGVPQYRILWRYVFPNMGGVLVTRALLQISHVMMMLAGLSFLGMGVKVPQAEWGAMISEGLMILPIAPWVSLGPAGVLVLVMIVFNAWGQAWQSQGRPPGGA